MKRKFGGIVCILVLGSISMISWKPVTAGEKDEYQKTAPSAKELFGKYVDQLYQTAQLQSSGLSEVVFQKALTGFINLKIANKLPKESNIVTVVDLSLPSHQKRMWIVDLVNKSLLLNTWVAHGDGSGDDMANFFSNVNDSHASSLGFYVTDNVYMGKHGRSLRLDGLDEGFNDNARMREIVVHAAKYVGQGTIDKLGHLGRSWGCPAVSPKVANRVINTIQGKTMLFINGNDDSYTSKYLDEDQSANYLASSDPAFGKVLASLN